MTTKKKAQDGAKGKAGEEELDAFARHFAEVLRIAGSSDVFSTRFYNDLTEAWNDFTNDILRTDGFWHSEEYILLALQRGARRAREGGAE